jgi:hypothetical protein
MKSGINNEIYMNYLGMSTLLGRLAGRVQLSTDDKECLRRAFADLNAILVKRNSDSIFLETHDGGYSLFDKRQVEKVYSFL